MDEATMSGLRERVHPRLPPSAIYTVWSLKPFSLPLQQGLGNDFKLENAVFIQGEYLLKYKQAGFLANRSVRPAV